MEIFVQSENLKGLLKEIKRQSIAVSMDLASAGPSAQFIEIDEVREFQTSRGPMTILIGHAGKDSRCIVIDIYSILNIKLNKYLQYGSSLLNRINVLRQNQHVVING